MALTVTNINTLSLLNILNRTTAAQSDTMTRLSTGSRINRGSDDPAGLLALNALDSKLTNVNAAITSNQRSDALLGVADSSLGEVVNLLDEVQRLAAASSSSAGATTAEIAANQAQIDNAIASIDRIIRTTEFNGEKLLDGALGIDTSGIDATMLTDVRVFNRNPSASSNTVQIEVAAAATRAATGTNEELMATSADADTTISVKGALGTQIIEISKDENLSSVLAKINDVSGLTGVVASQTADTAAIHLRSSGYGSDQFVKVTILEGGTTYDANDFNEVNETGVDADVRVNGHKASASGKTVYYNLNGLSLSFTLTDTANSAGQTTSFTVDTRGGATFQLGTDATTRATLGINGLFSHELGTGETGEILASLKSGGTYDLASNPAKAVEIAVAARQQVADLQGRIGGFQKYQVQTATNALTSMKESLSAVRSNIADVDYATETAELNRTTVLMQTALSLLGVANQQSAQVLSLLQ
jgi:flagellin